MFSGSSTNLYSNDSSHMLPRHSSARLEPTALRELEAMTEVRRGETDTPHLEHTIIPTEEAKYDRNENFEISAVPRQRSTPPVTEKTWADLLILGVQGFLELFYPSSGNEDDIVGNCPDDSLLTDEEMDNLAVFQGSVQDFVELQPGYVSLSKMEKIKCLLRNDDNIEWERRCRRLLTSTVLLHPLIQRLESYRAKLRAYLGTWNPGVDHCSDNIYLLDDQITAHRIPMVNQTDGVRSKLGVLGGVHAWDMKLQGPLGTHFTVGVSTSDAPLENRTGYMSLVGGEDGESWGWDVVWGNVSHNGRCRRYPSTIIYQYTSGDTIQLILDCNRGTLSFAVNEMWFGVAFNKLPTDRPLFPTVGMVFGNLEVSLLYLGRPPPLRN